MTAEELFKHLIDSIVNGEGEEAVKAAKELLNAGVPPKDIIDKGISKGLEIVGRKFEEREFFIPDMLAAAEATKEVINLLKPLLLKSKEVEKREKVVIGTVEGDIHDIGKNLVVVALQGAGFEVVDLGVDVSAEKFIEAIKKEGAKVLAMSALLTSTMPKMKEVIDALRKAGLRDKVKVVVGGAPVREDYAKEIGADAYGKDAWDGVKKVKELLGVE